ncbi:MAG TPA: carboxyvinyl-carboxyphosphonate phosphorylmutase [Rhodobiaceae bacterium]|nr:carboxyvinyl-carboxyphosphonate phosphorylmutase [Rhodobiaceae bacterium]|tara:strand:- start:139 stop:957 length:819 start_codon:yes stop_codon:yes gene_type:complete
MPTDHAALRKKIASQTVIAPGVFDGLSARLADSAGFDALYLSGYGVSASQLAKPDNGFLTLPDMQMRIETICAAISTPLIADADTGFDDIGAAVLAYEEAGAAGIQIEDQQLPKICGHISGREVIARADAVARITDAVAARQDADFLIVARTDAREQSGIDEAIERGRLFAEAGADILFIESPESEDEFRQIGAALGSMPLLANMVEGGRSPLIPRTKLVEMGFNFIIYPIAAMAASAAALHAAYQHLLDGEPSGQRVSFQELSNMVGFPEK